MELNESQPHTQTPVIINEKSLSNGGSQEEKTCWDRGGVPFSRMNSMECWDYTIELECLNGPQDLQLAAELGKTLLERNKELENLLRSQQRKCEDQKQEIEYLTKQNLALKEVNDTRMQIYESLDISIHDLEREKHQLSVESSHNKKQIKELNETIEKLELKCDEMTKQYEEVRRLLEQERRKNERIQESSSINLNESMKVTSTTLLMPVDSCISSDESKNRHISGSASEPETEEASTPTNPSKTFVANSGQVSIQTPFMNYSHDFSSIQPIYSQDSLSHDSGFKTGSSSSNCADHEELLRVVAELEDSKQQQASAQMAISELEHQISILSQENNCLQTRLAQSNTLDEMKSVHEELSFLEEVRQGQMCTRCLKSYNDPMTENTSYIGTDEDASLMEILNHTATNSIAPVYRSAIDIKDDDESSIVSLLSAADDDPTIAAQYNPYKELVAKYEALLEIQRPSRQKMQQPQSLLEELNSADFSSLNTKFTADDEKKLSTRHKTPTDFSEVETTSSGYSDEPLSTKATQTDNSSFLFTIVDGENGKFSIYDEAAQATAPIDSRFRERPQYRDLFKEIFTVLKKAAENKEEGDTLPLLDDNDKQATQGESKVPPVTPAAEKPPCDFETQSIMSSAISENSIAISECITKSERKKAKSYKKQAVKDEIENRPPVVQVIGGKLITPYNRLSLDFSALNAKKRSRFGRRRSKDKYGTSSGRDSSVCSNASSTSNTSNFAEQEHQQVSQNEYEVTSTCVEQETPEPEKQNQAPLTPSRIRKIRRPRELIQLQTLSTLPTGEWNGKDSLTIYNKKAKVNNPVGFYCRPTTSDSGGIVFKSSAASQELKKLKKLDLSYAEVLKQQSERQQRRNRRK